MKADNSFLYHVICNISDSTFHHYKNFWHDINYIDDPITASSFYHGSSGLALFEADLYKLSGRAIHLNRAKSYLNDSYSRLAKIKIVNAGLFIGFRGISWAISRFPIGSIYPNKLPVRVTNKERIDIFYGNAGIGLNYIQMYITSKKRAYLNEALKIAKDIISLVELMGFVSNDGISNRDDEYYGFAHGIAGITYFLNELYKYTGNKKILDMVYKTANILIDKKLEQHNKLVWPKSKQNDDVMPYWCHGLAGIGLTLSQISYLSESYRAALLKLVESLEIASTAVRSYGLCHGLSGIGETFLEIEKAFNKDPLKGKNKVLNYIIEDMDKDNNGDYIFGDSNEESHYIEFMIGHPGVAHFLMRCIDSSIPHFSLLNDPLCDLQVAVSLGLNSKMQLS